MLRGVWLSETSTKHSETLPDEAYGIAVDGLGNAYITGRTTSTEATFPELVGPDLIFNGMIDAFVAKINSTGSALSYAG